MAAAVVFWNFDGESLQTASYEAGRKGRGGAVDAPCATVQSGRMIRG
jgi:hypothetical protein